MRANVLGANGSCRRQDCSLQQSSRQLEELTKDWFLFFPGVYFGNPFSPENENSLAYQTTRHGAAV